MLSNLESLKLGPGSLRPGGATQMLIEGHGVGTIQHAGRWASEKSLHVYLQEAVSAFVLSSVDVAQTEAFEYIVASQRALVHAPLPCPWTQYFSRSKQWLTLQRKSKRPSITLASSS